MQTELFFNTIKLTGSDLSQARAKAAGQNERVFSIVSQLQKATPFQVWEHYRGIYSEAPITSLRRSLTTLTKQGRLQKLCEMKKERYGHDNHYWRVV